MSKRLIDADAFLKRNEVYADCEFNHPKYQDTLREIVEAEPSVDAVEVVHGMWLEEGNSCSYIFHCSVCGGVAYFVHGKGRGRNMERRFCGYRYCPNCGASMDGEEQNDEID